MVDIYIELDNYDEGVKLKNIIKSYFDEDERCWIICNPNGCGARFVIERRHVITLFLIIIQETFAQWLIFNGKRVRIGDEEFERLMA